MEIPENVRLYNNQRTYLAYYEEHCDREGMECEFPEEWIMKQGEFTSDMGRWLRMEMWLTFLRARKRI